jgi:hypothetical protein
MPPCLVRTWFYGGCGHTSIIVTHRHDCHNRGEGQGRTPLKPQQGCQNAESAISYTYGKCDWCDGLTQGFSNAHSDAHLNSLPEAVIEERRIFWKQKLDIQRLENERNRIKEDIQHDIRRAARRATWEVQYTELRLHDEVTNVPLIDRIQFFDSRNPDNCTLFSIVEVSTLSGNKGRCAFCLDELEYEVRQLAALRTQVSFALHQRVVCDS